METNINTQLGKNGHIIIGHLVSFILKIFILKKFTMMESQFEYKHH